MAGWNAITGARGIVAAFTMSILLQVGLVDVTTGLLLCARRRPGSASSSTRGPARAPAVAAAVPPAAVVGTPRLAAAGRSSARP